MMFAPSVASKSDLIIGKVGSQGNSDRRNQLETYLREISMIPIVRESILFKYFIGLQEKYPEYCQTDLKTHHHMFTTLKDLVGKTNSIETGVDIDATQRDEAIKFPVVNFKIIGEFLKKNRYSMGEKVPTISQMNVEAIPKISEPPFQTNFTHFTELS